MHANSTTEDGGLAESAYELITGTDTESQDGNYTDNISESVGSLDFHQPEDVLSLADTDHTCDDESVVGEEAGSVAHSNILGGTEAVLTGNTIPRQQTPDCSESDEDANSRSSLEYTQHSLKTPSILTPEASNVLDMKLRQQQAEGSREQSKELHSPTRIWLNASYELGIRAWEYLTEAVSAAVPGLLFAAVITILVPFLYSPSVSNPQTTTSVVISTITATTTQMVAIKSQTTMVSSPTSSSRGMGLIAVDGHTSDEWLFTSRKPSVHFTPLSGRSVMVNVSSGVKSTWLKKDCLSITSTRNGEDVETQVSMVDEGIIVQFPKREAYGVVNLLVKATCRPSVNKMVKVHFGKGFMEEAFERTRTLAHDLTELVLPGAAHEAEHWLEGAKKSFETASVSLTDRMTTVSISLRTHFNPHIAKFQEMMANLSSPSLSHVTATLKDASKYVLSSCYYFAKNFEDRDALRREMKSSYLDAQLFILEARLSAKIWWLKTTGRDNEYADYQQKAAEHVRKMRRDGLEKIHGSPPPRRVWEFAQARSKSRRCRNSHAGQGRDTHVCREQV